MSLQRHKKGSYLLWTEIVPSTKKNLVDYLFYPYATAPFYWNDKKSKHKNSKTRFRIEQSEVMIIAFNLLEFALPENAINVTNSDLKALILYQMFLKRDFSLFFEAMKDELTIYTPDPNYENIEGLYIFSRPIKMLDIEDYPDKNKALRKEVEEFLKDYFNALSYSNFYEAIHHWDSYVQQSLWANNHIEFGKMYSNIQSIADLTFLSVEVFEGFRTDMQIDCLIAKCILAYKEFNFNSAGNISFKLEYIRCIKYDEDWQIVEIIRLDTQKQYDDVLFSVFEEDRLIDNLVSDTGIKAL